MTTLLEMAARYGPEDYTETPTGDGVTKKIVFTTNASLRWIWWGGTYIGPNSFEMGYDTPNTIKLGLEGLDSSCTLESVYMQGAPYNQQVVQNRVMQTGWTRRTTSLDLHDYRFSNPSAGVYTYQDFGAVYQLSPSWEMDVDYLPGGYWHIGATITAPLSFDGFKIGAHAAAYIGTGLDLTEYVPPPPDPQPEWRDPVSIKMPRRGPVRLSVPSSGPMPS